MASTAVVTATTITSIKKYSILVTAHTDGAVANTLNDTDGNAIKFDGMLMRVTIVPGTGGDEPDDNWVMAINDDNSVDVLANQGAALDESTTITFCPGVRLDDDSIESVVPIAVVGELDLAGSGMGSANIATIVLYFS
jgi:hypothetical protein